MEGIDPAIINRIRAERGAGSEAITPVHHIPKPREPMPEETLEPTQITLPEKKSPRIVQLFRSAVRGVRGGKYDSAET